MKFINTILLITLTAGAVHADQLRPEAENNRRIFIYGGDIELKFIEYVSALVDKPEPQICYLPTASADNPDNIKYWEYICRELGLKPHILKVWIDSATQKHSFEEMLKDMDAIVVGGGNTLNMLGIWNYQGIDEILKNALDRGVILSGGSAGSICWFRSGVSDSRPVNLSVVEGLGLLPYSHCPHYNVPDKRDFYDTLVAKGALQPGYACDEHAGILFTNGKVTEAVASNNQAHAYFVAGSSGKSESRRLPSRVLLRRGAIGEDTYRKETIQRNVQSYMDTPFSMQTPLASFTAVQRLFAAGRYSEYGQYAASSIYDRVKGMEDKVVDETAAVSKLSTTIVSIFTYGDFAAVLSKGSADFYSLWYFLRENGDWKCLGEDIGGDSPADAEMTFREKAPVLTKQ